LLGVTFIVCIKSTLGATIQSAARLILGGIIAICYSLPIVVFCPKHIVIAIVATTFLVLIIVYTDLPVTVRRFTIVPTCIIILQWFNVQKNIDVFYILQIFSTLTAGSSIAVLITCLPLPLVPTAFRELKMRMRFVAQQARREVTAILLLISEYNNTHTFRRLDTVSVPKEMKRLSSEDADNGIEMPTNLHRDDDIYCHSTSFEDLRDDHLLSSDINDLHSLVNDEVKLMQRALGEIPYEPYFIFLNKLNSIRRCLSKVPFIKKFVKPESTLQTRLATWSNGLASIQRVITGMLKLENHHRAFVGQRQLINVESNFSF